MDKTLERLKSEVEEERRQIYMRRFGSLPEIKDTNRKLEDYN